jgi:hypothetical protein
MSMVADQVLSSSFARATRLGSCIRSSATSSSPTLSMKIVARGAEAGISRGAEASWIFRPLYVTACSLISSHPNPPSARRLRWLKNRSYPPR